MIDKLLTIFTALFFFLLPLYFLPLTNIGLETDKQALLVIYALITFPFLLIKILKGKRAKIISTPFDLPLILLSLTYLFSTFMLSVNKVESFTYPLGTATIIALVLFYFILTHLFSDSKLLNLKSHVLIFSSSLSALIILLKQFPTLESKFLSLSSSLGLPFISFSFLLPILVFLGTKIALPFLKNFNNSRFTPKTFIKVLTPLLLPILAAAIILTASSFLGFHLLTDQKPFFLPLSVAWTVMLEGFKNFSQFLLGVGPGNFVSLYGLSKPLSVNLTPFWSILFTTSANFPFTIISEAGVVAALIYFWIVVKIIRLFKTEKNEDLQKTTFLLPLVTALILQFIFPPNILLLTITIIFLAAATPKKETILNPGRLPFSYLILPLGLICLIGLILAGKFYLGDIYYRQSLKALENQKLGTAFGLAQQAINLNPSMSRYFILSSTLSLNVAQGLSTKQEATEAAQRQDILNLTQQAVAQAQRAIQLNRLNPQNWWNLASIYEALIGVIQGAAQFALDAYTNIMTLMPSSPDSRLAAANILQSAGQIELAQNLLLTAVNLKPDWNLAHYRLAMLLKSQEKYQEAALELQRTLDLTPIGSGDYKGLEQEMEVLKPFLPQEATPAASINTTPSPAKKPTTTPRPTKISSP